MELEQDGSWLKDEDVLTELQQIKVNNLEDALDGDDEDVVADYVKLLTEDPISGVTHVEGNSLTPMKKSSSIATPFVGMVFESLEEVGKHYLAYGESQGFGVVRGNSAYKSKGASKLKRCQTWKCECNGSVKSHKKQPDDGVEVVQKSHLSKKCGCPAFLYAALENNGNWVVKGLDLTHKNHNPTPSKSRSIAAYRKTKFHEHLRKRVRDGIKAGLMIRQVLDMFSEEKCGSVPVTDRDVRNMVDAERRCKLSEGDSNAMWQYFMKMVADNKDFFHAVRVDENNVLKDVLWIDARSRAAFKEYGDVVCLDSTHLTNDYGFPFANFVGVNHHGQTILFGCALIDHETTESYEWVLKTWLKGMGNNAPKGILTDQAAAIRSAVHTVMPQSRHRWCLWHIMKKWGTKLGALTDFVTFSSLLKSVIYDSLDAKEFECRWAVLVEEYKLSNVDWLCGLYNEREMWVPAFTKHIFWAGMRSTQRIESIHSFFDKFFDKRTLLREFVEKYCFAMEVRCRDEKMADDQCNVFTRTLIQPTLAVEKFFQHLYTDKKFVDVQIECQRCHLICGPTKKIVNNEESDYIVQDRVYIHLGGKRESVATERRRFYTVRLNKITHDISCECKLFECSGILCRHIIKVYDYHEVTTVPDKYVLRRWRKDIVRLHTQVKVAYHDPEKVENVKRYDEINVAFEPVAVDAMVNERATEFLIQSINEFHQKVLSIVRDKDDVNPAHVLPTDESSVGINNETSSFVGGNVNPIPRVESPCTPCAASNNYLVLTASSNVDSINDPVRRAKTGRGSYDRRQPIDEIVLKKARASAKAIASGNNLSTDTISKSKGKPICKTRLRVGAQKRNKGIDDTVVQGQYPIVNGVVQVPINVIQSLQFQAGNHAMNNAGSFMPMPMSMPMQLPMNPHFSPSFNQGGVFNSSMDFGTQVQLSMPGTSPIFQSIRPPPVRSYYLRSDTHEQLRK